MTRFEAKNPAFADDIRASFARHSFLTAIGARLALIEPGHAVIELDYAPHIRQQQGFFHGAAIGAIADVAGGYATLSLLPAGSDVVTVEYKINFAKPARGERLVARGAVVRAGKSISVARAEVDVVTNGVAETCAYLQATFFRVGA
jgi:uncharacterized protein (TIGR00369 family)